MENQSPRLGYRGRYPAQSMLKFSIRHLMLATALVAVIITLFFAYHSWRYTYRLSDLNVVFSINGELLAESDGTIKIPVENLNDELLHMYWHYTFADNDGSSNVMGNSEYLHVDPFFDGIGLRRTSQISASQELIRNSGLSSRFYWSAETVSGGCVVYLVVHLYNDGKISDTLSKTVQILHNRGITKR
jgi:hypothetical protein